jgi:hypothetical protein
MVDVIRASTWGNSVTDMQRMPARQRQICHLACAMLEVPCVSSADTFVGSVCYT